MSLYTEWKLAVCINKRIKVQCVAVTKCQKRISISHQSCTTATNIFKATCVPCYQFSGADGGSQLTRVTLLRSTGLAVNPQRRRLGEPVTPVPLLECVALDVKAATWTPLGPCTPSSRPQFMLQPAFEVTHYCHSTTFADNYFSN